MQIKLLVVSIFNNENSLNELNKFLRSHRVLEVQQEFVSAENGSYWCFSIRYIQDNYSETLFNKREKLDYRKILDDKTFLIFEKLRKCRKEIAKNDAVPAYAIFTDAELSKIAKLDKIIETTIKTIDGIGEKRTEKYGKLIAAMFNKDEKNREPNK